MPLPQPPVPLQDPCTLIHDGKLFAYQADAFQVLDLKEQGSWSKLSTGVAVNGSACVQGTVDGKDSFIVVGGTTSEKGYQGLQHYDFKAKRWSSVRPADGVAINRQSHAVAFLEQSSSILLYSGSQDNNPLPSTQTFIIHTTSPFAVEAFESSAPPVTKPIMLSYNSSHALMLGGDSTNTKLSLFGPKGPWTEMKVGLPKGLKDASKTQASVWTGSDGGKILEIFDMSVTPNQVTPVLLNNATTSGKPRKSSRSFSTSHLHSRKRKRDMTLADRPAYNSTLAPQDSRSGFSLASDSKTGLVIVAGGNSQDPLVMFNQTSNQWIDPNGFFGVEPTPTTSSQSTPSASSTTTTSPLPPSATSAAPAANKHVRDRSLTILGGVLGGVFGAAILLVIILVLLKLYRRRRDQRREQQKAEYDMDDKRDPLDFSDIGAPYMKEAGGSHSGSPNPAHKRNQSERSERSLDPRTIDRNVTASSESKRALLHVKGDSTGSGKSFWSRGTKTPEKSPPQISAPILGPPFARPLISPDLRTDQREESGWSRYFTHNNSREMLSNIPQPQQAQVIDRRTETYFSNSQTQSDYESSRIASSHPHESAEVGPLNVNQPQPPLNAGITSPNSSRPGLGLAITQGPSPDRDREDDPGTPSTPVSNLSNDMQHYSHESEGHDSWSPVVAGDERNSNWNDDRPISSPHNSRLYAHPGERVVIPNFPMPSSARNSAAPSPRNNTPRTEQGDPFNNHPSSTPGLRNVISRDLVRTKSGRLQATSDIRTGTQRVTPNVNNNSTRPGEGFANGGPSGTASRIPRIPAASSLGNQGQNQNQQFRTFPRPREELGPRGRGGAETEDMSWLNLGTSAEQRERDIYFPRN